MPVIIEELTTTFDIQDEVKIRKLVRQEIRAELAAQRRRAGPGGALDVDPADPAASGGPLEAGGG
jgi:hypothetical protein